MQTFLKLWRLKYLKRTTSAIIMSAEFIFVILLVGIGFGVYTRLGEYYAAPIPVCYLHMIESHREPYVRQYWCWIGNKFMALRIVGEYAWLGLTLVVSILLYIPLFLLHWGVIKPGTSWYSPKSAHVFQELYPDRESCGDHMEAPASRLSPSTLQVVSREDRRLWFIIL